MSTDIIQLVGTIATFVAISVAVVAFLRSSIMDLRTELRGEMGDLRAELRGDISEQGRALREEISATNERIDTLSADLSEFKESVHEDFTAVRADLTDVKVAVAR